MNSLLNFNDGLTPRERLWEQLLQQNIVQGNLPPMSVDQNSVQQAWYIRVMLGFAGWLGALFLMAFVGIGFSFVMDSAVASFSIGVALCTCAYVLFRAVKNQDFVAQFALAVSLAGQGFIVFGLFDKFRSHDTSLYAFLLLIELFLMVCMPNFIHRFLTCLASVCAAYLLLQQVGFVGLLHGVLALAATLLWWSPQLLRQPAFWRPIAYGLALASLFVVGARFASPFYWHASEFLWVKYTWQIGASLVNLALLLALALVLRREQVSLSSGIGVFALLGAGMLCGFSYVAPGLSSAILLICIAFSFSNRILLGVGLLALLSFLSHYYYQLQVSLLYKSIVLLSLAVLLLAVRYLLYRLLPQVDQLTEEGV